MSESKLSHEELLEIVKLFESSPQFSEFHLKYGDTEIDLRKHGAAPSGERQHGSPQPVPSSVPQPAAPPNAPEQVAAPVVGHAAPVAVPAFAPGACVIKSPMVGTFYVAPEPGAAPFVTVGQRVTPDMTVCIIEVMKLMHSVPAEHAGVITHVLIKDGEPVEFGQPLIVLDPNA